MSYSKNVVLAGATGNLGPALLTGLLDAAYKVTVLTRASNPKPATLPTSPNLTVVPVDYSSPVSLRAAIANHSAVISALPMTFAAAAGGLAAQNALIDACLAAGVPRFVPSAFGSDTAPAVTAALPVYAAKLAIEQRLQALPPDSPLSWTSIACGPYLDWCIMVGLFVDPKQRRVTYYDGGDVRFSATTLASVGRALAHALEAERWAAVRGRTVRVHDAVVTQRELVRLAKAVQKEKGKEEGAWVEEQGDTAALERAANEKYAQGKETEWDGYDLIKRAIWGEGYGGDMSWKVDNALLGMEEMGEDEIKEVVARYC